MENKAALRAKGENRMLQKSQEEPKKKEQRISDIHTHVLPGLDDGSKSIGASVRMLRKSYQQGVRNVIATPHYTVYHWRTKPEQIQRLMEQMAKAVQKVMPELRLYSGQEIQYFEGMADMLQRGELLTLAGSHYVLVEFLPQSQWSQIQNAVRELLLAGYFPVLAHIERYQCLRKTGRLTELQKEGAYLQMNYGSLIKLRNVWNLRERLERRWCRKVLLAGYISFLGTDMHGVHHRAPDSDRALVWIRKKGGDTLARQLSVENPEKIILDERL